jgi:hypothetical protein
LERLEKQNSVWTSTGDAVDYNFAELQRAATNNAINTKPSTGRLGNGC